jgi:hypothetical protein
LVEGREKSAWGVCRRMRGGWLEIVNNFRKLIPFFLYLFVYGYIIILLEN